MKKQKKNKLTQFFSPTSLCCYLAVLASVITPPQAFAQEKTEDYASPEGLTDSQETEKEESLAGLDWPLSNESYYQRWLHAASDAYFLDDIQPFATDFPGGDLGSYLNNAANPNDLVLTGAANWNTAVAVNNDRKAGLIVDGQGNTVTVGNGSSGNALFSGFTVNSPAATRLTLKNIIFQPNGQVANSPLITVATANTANFDFSGTTFTGFTNNSPSPGGSIMLIYGNPIVNIYGDGITFSNNRGGSADIAGVLGIGAATVTFYGSEILFQKNTGANYGGAINMIEASNSLTFTGKTYFRENNANYFGGAIDVWGGLADLTFAGETEFSGNYVGIITPVGGISDQFPSGGAIHIGQVGTAGRAQATFNAPVTFTSNFAISSASGGTNNSARGGAIAVKANAEYPNYFLQFNSAATFANNYAYAVNGNAFGGAIYYQSRNNELTFVSGTQFINNAAKNLGGAIYMKTQNAASAPVITLNATTDNILFQGNRVGGSFTGANYAPDLSTGTPNAIYFDNGQSNFTPTLNFNAGAGYKIEFYDPVTSASNRLAVNKTGAGRATLYGNGQGETAYNWASDITTNVSGGVFELANGIVYGSTVSTATIAAGGTLLGNNGASIVSNTVDIQSGGALGASGGIFTVNSSAITLQNGSLLTGFGTLAATSNLNMAGTVTGQIEENQELAVTGVLAGGANLSKSGLGTLNLAGVNTYTGTTTVNQGTLSLSALNAIQSSSSVSVAAGAAINVAGANQRLQNLSGAGNIALSGADLTVVTSTLGNELSGTISGTGGLIKDGTATLTISGTNTYEGGTEIANNMLLITNGSALGSGAVNAKEAFSILDLNFANDSTFANQLTGAGQLTKSAAGTATLTAANSEIGSVTVLGGNLFFNQNGIFSVSDFYYTYGNGTTSLGENARLTVTNEFVQLSGAKLNIAANTANSPAITAGEAELAGTLSLSNYTPTLVGKASELAANRYIIISTQNGITGDFDSFDFGGAESPVDYLSLYGGIDADGLTYSAGLGLTWYAGTTLGNGLFTLTNAGDAFEVDVALADVAPSATDNWDGESLTKAGDGTLTLSAVNGYTGATNINGGTLAFGIANSINTSSQVNIAQGALARLNSNNQTFNNLAGAGNISLGTAQLTVNSSGATTYSGAISGEGSLVKTGTPALTLSGSSNYTGGTNIQTGSIIATNGNALGTGAVTTEANAELELNFATNSTLANQLLGDGGVTKTGTGIATLTGLNSNVGSVAVEAGTLAFAQNGIFTVADSYTTQTGATTSLGANAKLAVTNDFTQESDSNLSIVANTANSPVITADQANLAGNLSLSNYTPTLAGKASEIIANRLLLIATESGINGDFDSVDFGGAASPVDYLSLYGSIDEDGLTYSAGLGLTWYAGATQGNGVFTLTNPEDAFNVDVALNNQTGSTTPWDGQTLTKAGAGTLTLSAVNGYTGATNINDGTLAFGVANSITNSSQVNILAGGAAALQGNNQTFNNLTGAVGSTITLGSAELTVNNAANTTFAGSITGAGSLVKTGANSMTLSGSSDYAGGTTINQGTLIATNGNALGTGQVDINDTLRLNFAGDSTLANQLSGLGNLAKTGAGTAFLTNANSAVGNVDVQAGILQFNQNGIFTVSDFYVTQNDATTTLGENARLAVTNAFTQNASSILNVSVGGTEPVITAGDASLAGTLNVAGFTATNPGQASALTNQQYTIVSTNTGTISGDFSSVNFGTATSPADYLTLSGRFNDTRTAYSVGLGLTWYAGTTLGNGVFTLTNAEDAFEVDVALTNQAASGTGWNGTTLTKAGAGTLTLSAVNGYTGATNINDGTLAFGIANSIINSSQVNILADGTANLNNYNQTFNNLTGEIGSAITLGSAELTVNNTADTTFAGSITGEGSLVKTGANSLTLSGSSDYAGSTTINQGTLIATNGGAVGTGEIAINDTLNLNFAANSTLNNLLSGAGNLTKTGAGTAILTAANSASGNVNVEAGVLQFNQAGIFTVSDSYVTQNGAATTLGENARLAVTNSFTQAAGSALNVSVGGATSLITAGNASLAGVLNVAGFTATNTGLASALANQQYTIVETNNGTITGDFASVNFGTATSPADYLTLSGRFNAARTTYSIGLGLTWYAGPILGNGDFTLTNAEDAFNVDVALDNQAASSTGWNGTTLTKAGAGTLTLSAVNGYTGATNINDGTLAFGIANSITNSSQVNILAGGAAALQGNNQTFNNLTGAVGSTITLGSAELTVNNAANTTFAGSITGAGSLVKTGANSMTLSGSSDYAGGTTINQGTLIATNGDALGSGAVTTATGAGLELNFAGNSTLANQLFGSGNLTKTGGGITTLTGANSSVGNVSAQSGTLSLAQEGVFTAENYMTQSNAVTSIGAQSQLVVSDTFSQASGATLNVAVGADNQPAIQAENVNLAGILNISGFTVTNRMNASQLEGDRFIVVQSGNAIAGDFSAVNFGTATSPADYLVVNGQKDAGNLTYSVGLGLTWYAGPTLGNGLFTLTNAEDAFNVDVALNNQTGSTTPWDGQTLTKAGAGTLTLSAVNGYTGATNINDGTLAFGVADSITNSSQVNILAGGAAALQGNNQTFNNLTGAVGSTITLGGAALTANNNQATTYNGFITGAGSLVKTGANSLTLTGSSDYAGGTTINQGTLIATNGDALGSGAVTTATGAGLELNFAGNSTLANQLFGAGNLTKTGVGVAILTGAGSAVGNVSVSDGVLAFEQTGLFTADNYTTVTGAGTYVGPNSQLEVTGIFTQEADSMLGVTIGEQEPVIKADSAEIDGELNIMGLSSSANGAKASDVISQQFTVISTDNGITGNFTDVDFGGSQTGVDYLILSGSKSLNEKDYNVGFGLTWYGGQTQGNGNFTLMDASNTFEVDVALVDQTGQFASGWDGKSLSKYGDGTLILSGQNTYTGSTIVDAGTLVLAADNTIASSSNVDLNIGSQLVLANGTAQTVHNLSGEGDIDLGSSVLTVTEDAATSFGGIISGAGSLVKNGTADLTLTGESDYTGGTTIQAGNVNITTGSALGTGQVTTETGTSLTLDFAAEQTLANTLSGSGDLVKTGAGLAQLTGQNSSIQNVLLNGGGLSFAQTGAFAANNYTAQSGTNTYIGEDANLALAGTYSQAADSGLYLALAPTDNPAKISAQSASIGGNLYITNFDTALPASALMARRDTVITTQNGIANDFTGVDFGGAISSVDYLVLDGRKDNNDRDYSVGYNLTWNTGPEQADGTFTLEPASSVFDVDVILEDKTGPFSSNWDGKSLTKNGAGTLILSEQNTYTGTTTVNDGTLLVGKQGTPAASIDGSGVSVGQSGTLSGTGSVLTSVANNGTIAALNAVPGYTNTGAGNFTVGSLTNAGAILLAGSEVGNTLTVQGGLTGQNGKLIINTVLGDDSSPTDKLILDGGATTGNTNVTVYNRGGVGAQTNQGILVIQALNNATTSQNAFTLATDSSGYRSTTGTLALGAFDYQLLRGGNGGAADSWYLVSDLTLRPEVGSYLVNREAAESMFYHSIFDRLEAYEVIENPLTGESELGSVWARIKSDRSRSQLGADNLRSTTTRTLLHAGVDLYNYTSATSGMFKAGLMGGFGHSKTKTDERFGTSSHGRSNAYLFGGYLTWFQDPERKAGWYADAWLQSSKFKNKVRGDGLSLENYQTHLFSASLETGYAYSVRETENYDWHLIPSLQVTYNNYSGKDFLEQSGTKVSNLGAKHFVTRVGLRMQGYNDLREPYFGLNWLHRSKTEDLMLDTYSISSRAPKNVLEFKGGVELKLRQNLTLGVDLSYQFGNHNFRNIGGQIALRYNW